MRLRALGGLTIEGLDFSSPKPLLLLCYLAIEAPQERRHLAELFWPGAANPMGNLATVLTRLRKAAPGLLEADDARAWTPLDSDVAEFQTALEQGQPAAALELYGGKFLDGFYLKDWSSELEEWIYARRETLAGRMREALLKVAEDEAGDGDFNHAARRAESAYLLPGAPEPTLDELRRLYTLLRAGESLQAPEVRKEAEAYGATLELSAEQARASHRTTATQAGTAPPGSLPVQPTRFVGRSEEKEALQVLLERPDCRLVTLVGPGGIGKTRLAIEVARAQQRTFKDGVYFAPFAAVTAPELMIYTLAEALGVTLEGQTDARTTLLSQLRERELLLVMDNLEHLLEGVSLITEVLTAAPRIKVLATSRERLDLLSEQLFEIPGLSFPRSGIEDLEAFDAVKLLMERAQRLRPGFQLTSDNAAAVARICRLVGGLPLALELAASWLRALTIEDVAAEIEKGLDVLQSTARDMPVRHRSIRAVFDHSWQLLSEEEQAVLSKLSVFRGGFRREAAAEVAGAGLPLLAHLVDRSFITVTEGGRYSQHPLVHEYCQERLAESLEEQRQTLDRHGRYYTGFIRDREPERWGSKVTELLVEYDEELENLRAAWRWAVVGHRLAELQQSAEAFLWYTDIRTRYQDGIDTYAYAVQGLDENDPQQRGVLSLALTQQSHLLYRQGRLDEAIQQAQRGLALAEPLGKKDSITNAMFVLGTVAELKGDYPEAKRYHQEALALAIATERPEIVVALKNLANVELALGHYQQAQELFHEALALCRRRDNPLGVVVILSNLGGLALLTDGPHEARTLLQDGLELAHEIGFRMEIPYLLRNLAAAAYDLGALEEAEALCREALAIARENGTRTGEAAVLTMLGRVMLASNRHAEGQACFRQGLDLAWTSQEIARALETLVLLASSQIEQGRLEPADRWLRLAVRHPATPHRFRQEAHSLLDSLGSQHSEETLEQATDAAPASELQEVVAELLN